ncbi:unnamed protein product [Rhizophagus irregularis]|nr:unnamed protein product [Rhizophagus irregularis]
MVIFMELLKLQILLPLLKYNNLYHQTYIPPQSGHEHVEIAKVKDGTNKGIFADNYSLNHVIPVEGNNLFMNEISHVVNVVKGFTQFVKTEYGIILKARDMLVVENNDILALDVKVELRSDITLPELSISDDELNTSKES